jgi:predicted nucleotidyltransferase
MESFAQMIRDLRKKRGDPLRIIAAYLDIDQAILSKIEHGYRKASRDQVIRLADYFGISRNDLLLTWLSDKLVDEAKNEELALNALHLAEEKITYLAYVPTDHKSIIRKISNYLKKNTQVTKAWIFGSFARGEVDFKSDIDLLIEVAEGSGFSYFDLAEIQYNLESVLNRKIDIGFNSSVRYDINKRIQKDLKLIYEKSIQ